MKVFCDQKDLAFALNIVNRAVSPNNTLPVLNNIYLKVSGKKLYLHATNLEITLMYTIDSEVINEGEITVPAKLFTNFINLLSPGKVELKLDSSNQVLISTKDSNTKINSLTPEDFPSMPELEKDGEFTIDSAVLRKAIDQTVFAASLNTARPILTGVLFNVDKDTLRLVATDSYRLANKVIIMEHNSQLHTQCVLPAHTMSELSKILSSGVDKKVRCVFSKNQILFEFGHIQLYSRLVEGTFPDYQKIIPTSQKTTIEVAVNDLISATRRVSILVADVNNNIKLAVTNDGKITLSTGETYVGEGTDEVEAKVKGDNSKTSLNAQYLLDVLQVFEGETIIMQLDSKITPILLKPVNSDDYIHIIMPLKV